MEDIQEQLAALRRRIAGIDRKYAAPAAGRITAASAVSARPVSAAARYIQDLMSGEVVRTSHGEHFETEKLWERHRRHGSVDIADHDLRHRCWMYSDIDINASIPAQVRL